MKAYSANTHTHTQSCTHENINQSSRHSALITLLLSLSSLLSHSTSSSEVHWPLIGVLMSALLIIHIHLFLSSALFYFHSPSIHQESLSVPEQTPLLCSQCRVSNMKIRASNYSFAAERPWYGFNWGRSILPPIFHPPCFYSPTASM